MKLLKNTSSLSVVLLISLLMSISLNARNGKGHGNCKQKCGHKGSKQMYSKINNMPKEDLSGMEVKLLQYMREEEKLALDVYTKLNEKWNMRIFENISKAESRHYDVLGILLQKYELNDPSKGLAAGKFNNADLQKAYDSFIKQGMKSKEQALLVGAEIEDLDIYDIMKDFESIDNLDIKFVLNNLARGSRNHMRAFIKNLNNYSLTYKPKYISQDDYNSIINSDRECGRR